jgi:hypothetical protein
MLVGYDVFHKPKANSYLAFTSTMNRNFNQYWSRFKQQREYEEIASSLEQTMVDCLTEFNRLNRNY